MKQLVLAEKPSVGADLARALGLRASSRGSGVIEGPDLVITWCVGHLVELAEPHEYRPEWKRWSARSLPILPEAFKLRPRASARDQWKVVSTQLRRRDIAEVINACDAGREGELIFRMVYELAGCRLPVRRLWISSLTAEAIRDGFRRLRPGEEFDDLAAAAACRNRADWLVGINATRGATIMGRAGQSDNALRSVGRVQTPTLAMIAERDAAIEGFVPEDYFELWAEFEHRDVRYRGQWRGSKDETRFAAAEEARRVETSVQGREGVVEALEQKTVEEKPPLLFDLTSLQRTANRAFGLSAARTLSAAQALYEKHKVLTYPRTDSRFLTPDLVPTLRDRIEALETGPYSAFARSLLNAPALPPLGRLIQPGKVKDHHAILPTSKRPQLEAFSAEERKVYDLVARRFLGSFYPPARFLDVVAITRVDTPGGPAPCQRFRSHGKKLLEPGWRSVAGYDDDQDKSRPARSKSDDKPEEPEPDAGADRLARLRQGDPVRAVETGIDQKQTKPPARYTDASLLGAMEAAGKRIEDEALRAAMKDSGLGTPATRAQIIETLLERGYVVREGKSFQATEAGRALLAFLPVAELKSAELTGRWEARLARMARGEEPADRFMQDIRDFVASLTSRLLAAPPPKHVESVIGRCPRCGNEVVRGSRFFECRDARQGLCKTRIPMRVAGAPLSEKLVAELLAKGRSRVLKGFRSKAGKKFSAVLVLDEEQGVRFDFDAARRRAKPKEAGPVSRRRSRTARSAGDRARGGKSESTSGPSLEELGPVCPQCGLGKLVTGRRGWGCSRWKEGCSFVVWFETAGKRLTIAAARELAAKGRTRLLSGFRDEAGHTVRGRLVLRAEGGKLGPVLEPEPS
jgi:DNA topoisomerase III